MHAVSTAQLPGEAPSAGEGHAADPWHRPPIATSPLSAILVTPDAGPDLEEVIRAWARQLDGLSRTYEILLVHDSDDVGARADALAQQLPALRVLRHAGPSGPGAALRAGIAAARHPLLCYTTGDRQYRPEDLKPLLERIDKVDLVTGCRTGRPNPGWRRAVSAAYRFALRVVLGIGLVPSPCAPAWTPRLRRWVARWLFGVRVHDPECALRLCRRSIFRRIPLQSDGDLVHVEILAKANFLGRLMDEAPVAYQPPAPGAAGTRRRGYWKEVRRLVRAADFGPAVLPPEEPADQAAPAAEIPKEAPAPGPT